MTGCQNTKNPQTVCVIPARSGSKRIPDKNIRLFLGKPVSWYPIQAARDSNLFDRIIVSTDSEKIAAIARETGAETLFIRPPELADDHTPVTNVFKHAARWMRNNQMDPKYIYAGCMRHPFLFKKNICSKATIYLLKVKPVGHLLSHIFHRLFLVPYKLMNKVDWK